MKMFLICCTLARVSQNTAHKSNRKYGDNCISQWLPSVYHYELLVIFLARCAPSHLNRAITHSALSEEKKLIAHLGLILITEECSVPTICPLTYPHGHITTLRTPIHIRKINFILIIEQYLLNSAAFKILNIMRRFR